MKDQKTDRFRFHHDKCTFCGECFARCQYINLTRAEAVEEIKRLADGDASGRVPKECVSCQSCDAFCPEKANPYALILGLWARRYSEKGLPIRAEYMLPYRYPNYRHDAIPEMTAREKQLLEKWKTTEPRGEILYPGCNLLTAPSLYDQKSFETLEASGDWSLCCGEPYYRLGAFDATRKISADLAGYYSKKKIEKMIFVCPACMNMFENGMPSMFGAKFDFECEYVVDWIMRRVESGAIKLKKLDRTITIHDSCHGRVLGDPIMERTRELLRAMGLKIVEAKNHRENGICCGIAAGCNRQMPQDIYKVGSRALGEAAGTGIAETAIYCGGCYLHLGIIDHISRSGQRLVHVLELLAESTGGRVDRVLEKRTRSMLWRILTKPMPKLASRKRFKL